MSMSDEERLLWVLVEEFEHATGSVFEKVRDEVEWVDSIDEAKSLASRMKGVFVASLVGEVEEKIGRKFSSVFQQLSSSPTVRMSKYWFENMPVTSSAQGRAKVMWAIRLAYTHGNGRASQIDDTKVRNWIDDAFSAHHFDGISLDNDLIKIPGTITYPAAKTALEIINKFR